MNISVKLTQSGTGVGNAKCNLDIFICRSAFYLPDRKGKSDVRNTNQSVIIQHQHGYKIREQQQMKNPNTSLRICCEHCAS